MSWKDWFSKDGADSKKLQLLIVVIVAAVAVVFLSGGWGSNPPVVKEQPVAQTQSEQELQQLEASLQGKIAGVLQKIDGVGKVSVAVTLSSGPRSEFGVNQTHSKTVQEETPEGGGSRTSTQTNDNTQMVLAGSESSGSSQPVTIVQLSPQVSGVLVVAEGAKNPYVLEKVQKSVQTLLGIAANKIIVEPMSEGGN